MIEAPNAVVRESMNRPLAYVLDDDNKVADMVCRMLTACGFVSRMFFDPTPCLQQIKTAGPYARPAVMVLDLALGQFDAIDVIRRLESLNYKGKVLLISGSDEPTLLEVQKVGVSRGLAMLPPLKKPFRINEFKESLDAKTKLIDVPPEETFVEATRVPLIEALTNGWLELWYQPKIDLKSLSICGAEALLRARHPTQGIVPPARFLPAAGDPLYIPLSRFVIRQAMMDWVHHFAGLRTPLRLAVNVPLSVIVAPGFIHLVRDSLPKDTGFPGLIIEATEEEVIRDVRLAREIATQLKLHRIWLSIDDFGTAYSSFARLRDLPFVELKLDRSFVLNCSSDQTKKTLCQSAIDLAHRFGASVCAEGVENPEDLHTLIDMGCDTAQGFLFAKPQPVEIFKASLAGPTTQPKANSDQDESSSDREAHTAVVG
jgi:EAL domain-containing protein (putative c-di-GMP-specific phosphodiesterase class I)